MNRRNIIALAATLTAGLAAAIALTAAPAASAWDINALPAGYTTQQTVNGTVDCYYIFGYNHTSPELCTDSPTFQADVDSFVNATCPPAVCAPPPATTTTDQGTTTTDPTATTPATTTTAPPATVTIVTTTVDPTIDARLTALEQRQTVDEARITTLEQKAGLIVGEPKNVAPFTNVV